MLRSAVFTALERAMAPPSARRVAFAGRRALLTGSWLLAIGCAGSTPAPAQPARVYSEEEVRAAASEISMFLNSLMQRQQEYHRTVGRYAASLTDLEVMRPAGYEVRITEGTERGWAAEAYRAAPRVTCSIYGGVVSALPHPSSLVQGQAGRPYCSFGQPVER